LTGNLNVTIGGKNHMLRTGQAIVAPAGMPHALTAPERVRLLRLVVFS
jgi:quercetin dioxygenase-like cupin family protein